MSMRSPSGLASRLSLLLSPPLAAEAATADEAAANDVGTELAAIALTEGVDIAAESQSP